MEDIYEKKKAFVEGELSACLQAAACDVLRLEYHRNGYGENVIVFFKGGGSRCCVVDGDSHLAIIRDVLRQGEF